MSLEIQLRHPEVVVEAHVGEASLDLGWNVLQARGVAAPEEIFERVAGVAVPGRVDEHAAHGRKTNGKAVGVAHADEAEEGDYQGRGGDGCVREEGLVELAADDEVDVVRGSVEPFERSNHFGIRAEVGEAGADWYEDFRICYRSLALWSCYRKLARWKTNSVHCMRENSC